MELLGHTNEVTCVDFDPYRKRIVSCSADTTVKIWNTRSYCLEANLKGHSGIVY